MSIDDNMIRLYGDIAECKNELHKCYAEIERLNKGIGRIIEASEHGKAKDAIQDMLEIADGLLSLKERE